MSQDIFARALQAEGFEGQLADLARSIFVQESSGGKNNQTSNRGAVGGMQILPGTFKEVADKGWDINNPEHNYRAGLRYLNKMYEYGGQDPRMAAIGYYGGPGGIRKAREGIAVSDPKNPDAPNTFGYADKVVGRMGESQPQEAVVAVQPSPYTSDSIALMQAAQQAEAMKVAQGEKALMESARRNPFGQMNYAKNPVLGEAVANAANFTKGIMSELEANGPNFGQNIRGNLMAGMNQWGR